LDLLAKGILRKELNLRKLPKGLPQDAAHQGAVAEIDVSKLMVPYEEFIRILDVTYDTGLVLLGEVQDPQNVGAVIRSAAAFGIAGVLIPEHRQAQVNGTVIKVSAGMAFRIPLVRIGNVNTVVENLKEHGFWIYGLDGSAEKSVSEEKFEKPSVLILGNESTGIREKTLMHSDIPLRIPMSKKAESLNAAAAAAIVLSVWSTHHRNALN
jgi:23S rRNA (guanosine2251-2'-O)-methyltransferase